MKQITKIDTAKFKVVETEQPDAELTLDFARIIKEFDLKGNFYLIHWQARPKGFREWGIYSSRDDSYTSTDKIPPNFGDWSALQLDDKTASTIPSAVVCFRGYMKNCRYPILGF